MARRPTLARTCTPIPARSRSAAGRRTQPWRSTTRTGCPEPSPLTRPSRRWIVRCVRSAILSSCVTTSAVARAASASSSNSSTTIRVFASSSSPVGSSARTSFGRLASAAQTATRCCSPPDSSAGSAEAAPTAPPSTAAPRRDGGRPATTTRAAAAATPRSPRPLACEAGCGGSAGGRTRACPGASATASAPSSRGWRRRPPGAAPSTGA